MTPSFKHCLLILGLLTALDILVLLNAGTVFLYVVLPLQAVASGVAAWIVKGLDYSIFFFIEAELSKKQPIVREVWEDAVVLAGWLLILVPGIFTGFTGLVLLNREARNWLVDTVFYDAS